MSVRLPALVSALLAVVMLSLGVPLAFGRATNEMHAVFYDRLEDAARFADEASTAATPADERALAATLHRYGDVYGITAVVLNLDGSVRASSWTAPQIPRSAAPAVRALLAGRRPGTPNALLPWDDRPITVGQVIIRKGDIVGAVVIVSPTDAARGRVRQAWMLLCGICVSALGGVVVLTRLLARSVSGPVQVLGETTARIRGGELQARAPAETGPPELRHLAESFNSMAEHMQVVIETQDQSMANASHQLRNPLTALLMRLERLSLVADVTDSEHGEDDAGQTRVSAAADALDEGRHLAGTLDDMLALARADHAQRPGGEVNVAEVADQRMGVWSLVAEKREVRLMRTGVQHAVGRHDGESLGGALDAVIDNALKFSGAGSTVTVDIATSPTHVTVTVSDEGPGLQPAEWARVTDRFWRGRRHPNVAGSGLGMSIAATLMKRHGGTLAVRAAPSGGLQVDMTVEKV